jgi:dienelactone hydrolase
MCIKIMTAIVFLLALFPDSQAAYHRSPLYSYDFSVVRDIDPFTEYLDNVPPVLQTISSTNSGSGDDAITTKEIVFGSKNNINKIYGIMAYPQRAGKFPGILVIHGGSGNAAGLRPVIERLARKGYVAFACDMAGFCNTGNTPYSSGPWKAKPAPDEAPRFNIVDGLQNSSLVDSEVAGIEAFNLLRAQPDVDADKMGITGYSWGGYSTTMLAGLLGNKVKAAYAYWGCGFYDKGSFWKDRIAKLQDTIREKWLTYLDAGRRAPEMKANYFVEAASNDTYFWPEAVSATLQAIPGAKNHVWGPNVNHKEVSTSIPMQELYFDYYLKGIGSPFGGIEISKVKLRKDTTEKVTMKLKMPVGITVQSVKLYYSEPDVKWQTRVWKPLDAERKNEHTYSVIIPADLVSKHVNFYAYLTDSRNVVTSSYMY